MCLSNIVGVFFVLTREQQYGRNPCIHSLAAFGIASDRTLKRLNVYKVRKVRAVELYTYAEGAHRVIKQCVRRLKRSAPASPTYRQADRPPLRAG